MRGKAAREGALGVLWLEPVAPISLVLLLRAEPLGAATTGRPGSTIGAPALLLRECPGLLLVLTPLLCASPSAAVAAACLLLLNRPSSHPHRFSFPPLCLLMARGDGSGRAPLPAAGAAACSPLRPCSASSVCWEGVAVWPSARGVVGSSSSASSCSGCEACSKASRGGQPSPSARAAAALGLLLSPAIVWRRRPAVLLLLLLLPPPLLPSPPLLLPLPLLLHN